jgi:hypothetical protein
VTGASSGLGSHFAEVLARASAKVILGARRLDLLNLVAEDIQGSGGACRFVELDVTNSAGVFNLSDAPHLDFIGLVEFPGAEGPRINHCWHTGRSAMEGVQRGLVRSSLRCVRP